MNLNYNDLSNAMLSFKAWKDEYLVWNPDDYNGLQEIFIIPSDVWTPRLVLHEK